MRKSAKAVIITIVMPILIIGLTCLEASPEKINFKPQAFLKDSVFIPGEFYYLNVTLDFESENIYIVAYSGNSLPECDMRSSKNYYRWEYKQGVWRDASGYDSNYIDASKCDKNNKTYSFYIGISKNVNPGSWTIKIFVDNKKVLSKSLNVVIGDFCLFFSSIFGVFEPYTKNRNFFVQKDLICNEKEKKIIVIEKNIDETVDEVLRKKTNSQSNENSSDKEFHLSTLNEKPLDKQEIIKSDVFTYPRSKLKLIENNMVGSLFLNKLFGEVNSFCKNFFVMILAIFLILLYISPIVVSPGNNVDNADITIINIQSYPLVGDEWTVMFTTVGTADLTITAVNGTIWSDNSNSYDLRFLKLKCGNESLSYRWVNNSVFIENYSSDETGYETCKVLTNGKHTLEFRFGNNVAYAYNDASDHDFKIQRGNTTIAAGTTTATIIAGTDYDTPIGDAFIRIVSTRLSGGGYTGGGGTQAPNYIMATIKNPENIGTNITFERSASHPTWDSYLTWEIIEYVGSAGGVNEIKVRNTSTITVSGASATTGVIPGIVDDNDVVVFITGQRTDGTNSGDTDKGLHTAQWNSAEDTATFIRGDSGNNGYVSYAVVEFTGSNWKIQRVTHQQTATGPQTENLGTELEDINKTFLHVQTRTNSGNLDEQGVETWISSTTQLSFQRDASATATQNVVAWVIENIQTYGIPMSVEHIAGSRGTSGPEPDIWTETITTVNATDTSSIMGENARSTGGGTAVPRGNIQLKLTDTSTVTLWTSDNGQTQNYRFSVVQWPTTDKIPPTSSVDSISSYWYNASSLTITAAASDDGGIGVKNVTLYWYNSTDNNTWNGPWNYGTDNESPWSWDFNFPNGSGYYRFYSIATDNLSNLESFTGNDTECGYDTSKPSSQVDLISPYWNNASDNPLTITETNPSDDLSGIKNITLYYHYRANNGSIWGSWNFFSTDENAPWSWDFTFPYGDGYYQFYSIAYDTAGNKEDPPSVPDNDSECGYDTIKPTSQVDSLSKYWYNGSDNPLDINVTSATDSLSGVKSVSLYHRYRVDNDSSWDDWEFYGVDESAPWQWSFNFPENRGHYQFYSIACDNASNYEDPPITPDNDTECGYNTTKPSSKVDDITSYWQASSPLTITGHATDFSGSGLKNVTLYYYNSTNSDVWYGPTNFGVDTDPWVDISWNFNFPNGTGYYRFYSIAIDNSSNVEDFTVNDTECGYDIAKPSSQVDAITPYWYNSSDNPLAITVTSYSDDLSGVNNVSLYYRYRADNGSGWNSWLSFGVDESSPWSWDFSFPSGSGHYQFYSRANDTAGNQEDSPVSPEYDTYCGYDTGKPTSYVEPIMPYNQSAPNLVITADASNGASGVKNVTLWYRYSEDNSTWESGKSRIKVQKIIGSLSGSTSKTEPIEPVSSLDRAFIIYEFTGQTSSDKTPAQGMSCAYLSDTGNVTIEKSSSTGGSDYSIYVIECLNEEFIVRKRGSIVLNTTETSDTDLVTSIKDVSKVFISSSQRSDGTANTNWYNSYCTVELTDSTTVTAERSASGINVVVRYEVVEWLIDDITVQTKEKTLTNLGTTEQTDIIDTSVDTSRSFVYATFRHESNGLSQTSVRYRLVDSSTVGFMRGGGTYTSIARWWVVQFPSDSVTVNRGIGSQGAPNDIIDITVPSCDLTHSFPISCGSNSGTGSLFPRGRYYANLSSETNLRLVCGYSGNTQYYAWQVIDTSDWTATGYNWSVWDNINQNPDNSSPWQWVFDFPNGTGYYEFYSIATDLVGNIENPPAEKDAMCYYNPYVPSAPIINSYDLRNTSGSKLNNATGLLDVNEEYTFNINITDNNGWSDIEYIKIKAWYDNGSDNTTYNQTLGGNLNMFLQYVNITGTASWYMLWPHDEATLVLANCSETVINSSTMIVNFSFKPGNQTRWAPGNGVWNTTQNTTNDPYSWNFNITVTDVAGLKDWRTDEYGVYKFTSILPEQDWVDVIASPGFSDTSNIVTITYSSNYNFNISIYFEENLTNVSSGYYIPIANNVYILANADLNDDITESILFLGVGETYAVDIYNKSGIFNKNGVSQTVNVQFEVYIPFGTFSGKYTARVNTNIKHD